MLIASWNVNSIRSRLSQITSWIKHTKPDVLCLQETKVVDKDFPLIPFENLGYKVIMDGQKSYNGVAIISKADCTDIKYGFKGELKISDIVNEFDEQKRIISALINGIRIINIYVPNGSSLNSEKFEYKINWLNKLNDYLIQQEKRGEHTCLLGDFNIAPSNNDIYDPNRFVECIMASKIERETLKRILKNRFIDSFRVFEEFSGHWSWWDYRNNSFMLDRGWRIDLIYVSNNLLPRLKSSVIERDQRGNDQPSDHVPVMINIDYDEVFNEFDDEDEDIFEI